MTEIRRLISYLLRHPVMRFGLVGVIGFIVDASVLAFDTDILHFPFLLGRAVSISFGMACTYLGNRYLTFAEQRAHGASAIFREWLKFVAANTFGALLNYSVSALVVYFMPPPFNSKYVGLVCGVAAGMVSNFTLSKRLVFKGQRSGPPSPT